MNDPYNDDGGLWVIGGLTGVLLTVALILIVVAGCISVDQPPPTATVPVPTATGWPGPTDTPPPTAVPVDPTPTQEMWFGDCLTGEQPSTVVNPNPCLKGLEIEQHNGNNYEVPTLFGAVFYGDAVAAIEAVDGGFGVPMAYYDGSTGLATTIYELPANRCHLLIVDGFSTVTTDQTWEQDVLNFYIEAHAITDDGVGLPVNLGAKGWGEWEQAPEGWVYQNILGDKQFIWPFIPAEQRGATVIEVVVGAQWGTGRPGSMFRFDSFIVVRPSDISQCVGVPSF